MSGRSSSESSEYGDISSYSDRKLCLDVLPSPVYSLNIFVTVVSALPALDGLLRLRYLRGAGEGDFWRWEGVDEIDRGDTHRSLSCAPLDCGDIDILLVVGSSRPLSCSASSAAEGSGAFLRWICRAGGTRGADMLKVSLLRIAQARKRPANIEVGLATMSISQQKPYLLHKASIDLSHV